MKTMKQFLIAVVLALMFVAQASAQTATVRTTLTNAISSTAGAGTINIVVGSTTGMTASTSSAQTFLLIDAELFQVASVVNSTTLTVRRTGTSTPHIAGAEVRWGPGGAIFNTNTGNTAGVFFGGGSTPPSGACTRASNQYLPVFVVASGTVTAYDCPNSVTTTTGHWISWQYYPGTSEVSARTALPSTVTAYTALVSDYYIAVTTAFTPDNATITVTLPCSSVPAGKIWIVGDEGGQVGTTGNGISILGALDTQQVLVGYTARAYRSNGTNCFRLY